MMNYYGCPCPVCSKKFTTRDDIVVCPECGTPHHRSCYQALGHCANESHHAEGFEWAPPAGVTPDRRCPSCGEYNPHDAVRCSRCGRSLTENNAEQNGTQSTEANPAGMNGGSVFDYSRLYAEMHAQADARAKVQSEISLDGISGAEWEAYLGPRSSAYLRDFSVMQAYRRKSSISFGALLFGPFYFFYRKAWKPAFAFLGIELLLTLPTLLDLMVISESPLAPNLSSGTLLAMARFATFASFVVMVLRGMYGKYLYRRSAAERIHRIQADFPDRNKRLLVLSAQGGVSWAAVAGAFMLVMLFGAAFSVLLGPNVQAVLQVLY